MLNPTLVSRFLARLSPVMGDPEACWEWPGARLRRGYGCVMEPYQDGKRRTYQAHRLSYEHHVGPIPEGLLVMHSCDNPPCCNPAHLVVGTHADNMADMAAKGRALGTAHERERCKSGRHAMAPGNLIWRKDGHRQCRACKAEKDRARYA